MSRVRRIVLVLAALGLLQPTALAAADTAPVTRPSRVWTVTVNGDARVTATPDGGALVSRCGWDDYARVQHRRISADGRTRVRYLRFRAFRDTCQTPAIADDGAAYFVNAHFRQGIIARRPDGTVRWRHRMGEDSYPAAPPTLINGQLWFTISPDWVDVDDLVRVDRATGRFVFRRSGFPGTDEGLLPSPEGPVVVGSGYEQYPIVPPGVWWLDDQGTQRAYADLPPEMVTWSFFDATTGADGTAFAAGCAPGGEPVSVQMRSPDGDEWSWSAPAAEGCAFPELTATSDGGVLVGRAVRNPDHLRQWRTSFAKLDAAGQEQWTHTIVPPSGRLVGWALKAQTDPSGRLVLAATYRRRCDVGWCRRGMIQVLGLDGTVQETLLPPGMRWRFAHGTTLTDLAIAPERAYVVLQARNGTSVAVALQVPGFG